MLWGVNSACNIRTGSPSSHKHFWEYKKVWFSMSNHSSQLSNIVNVLGDKLAQKDQNTILEFGRLLLALIEKSIDEEAFMLRLQHDIELQSVLEALYGSAITTSSATITFGDYSQVGDVKLERIAGRDIVEINPIIVLNQERGGWGLPRDDENDYIRQIVSLHNAIEFIGIPDIDDHPRVLIDSVYVPLMTVPRKFNTPMSDLGSINVTSFETNVFGELNVHVMTETSSRFLDEIITTTSRIVVLGDAGSGKTTMLRRQVARFATLPESRADEKQKTLAKLPIYVPLGKFARERKSRPSNYSLCDFLYTYAYEDLMLELRQDFFQIKLREGNCILLLDGLDEAGDVNSRREISNAIKALVTKYPANHFIVTSRDAGYGEAPCDTYIFQHCVIAPLRNSDIFTYIKKWYALQKLSVSDYERITYTLNIAITQNARLRELASNPLLLSIIVLIYRLEARIPVERSRLFDKCVEALMETRDAAKGFVVEGVDSTIYPYRKRLLEQIASHMQFSKDGGSFVPAMKEGDLCNLVAELLRQNRRLPFKDDENVYKVAQNTIKYIKKRTSLLKETEKGVYRFPHQSFQEYLAASDIVNSRIFLGIQAIWDVIKPHLHKPQWREVILLLFGCLNRYDNVSSVLVEKIIDEAEYDPTEQILHRHLFLAAQIVGEGISISQDVVKRIVVSIVAILSSPFHAERDDALSALKCLPRDVFLRMTLLKLAETSDVNESTNMAVAIALARLEYFDEAASVILKPLQLQLDDSSARAMAQQLADVRGNVSLGDFYSTIADDPRISSEARYTLVEAFKARAYDILLSPEASISRRKKSLERASAVAVLEESLSKHFISLVSAFGEQLALQMFREIASLAVIEQNTHKPLQESIAPYLEREYVVSLLNGLATKSGEVIAVRCNAALAIAQCNARDVASDILLAIIRERDLDIESHKLVYESLYKLHSVYY